MCENRLASRLSDIVGYALVAWATKDAIEHKINYPE